MLVRRAMLLAAGLGTRLRPLTDRTPKPLIEVGGRPLLDYNLAHFEAYGCERVVVNTHHHAEQVTAYLEARTSRCELLVSHEPTLLDSGGGLVQALPRLGDAPFFSANSDAFWLDTDETALSRLAQAFDAERMDALLLLVPSARAVGYSGAGDFEIDALGRLMRGGRSAIFTGLQILHPRLFAGREVTPFSLREIYAKAEGTDGRLARMYALMHHGDWVHVGAPHELEAAERFLAERARGPCSARLPEGPTLK
jgi:MurNAc alpha-1-phosphate uridylyltransferase